MMSDPRSSTDDLSLTGKVPIITDGGASLVGPARSPGT
jgi:hypothetical protein